MARVCDPATELTTLASSSSFAFGGSYAATGNVADAYNNVGGWVETAAGASGTLASAVAQWVPSGPLTVDAHLHVLCDFAATIVSGSLTGNLGVIWVTAYTTWPPGGPGDAVNLGSPFIVLATDTALTGSIDEVITVPAGTYDRIEVAFALSTDDTSAAIDWEITNFDAYLCDVDGGGDPPTITSTLEFTRNNTRVGSAWRAEGVLTVTGGTLNNPTITVVDRTYELGDPITSGFFTLPAEGGSDVISPVLPAGSYPIYMTGVSLLPKLGAHLEVTIESDEVVTPVSLIDDTINILNGDDEIVGTGLQLYLVDDAGDPAWVDITGLGPVDDAGVKTERRSTLQGPYLRYEGGSLTFRIDDDLEQWDPLNPLSRWWVDGATLLRPGLRARVIVTPDVGADPVLIWSGRVSYWPEVHSPFASSVTVTCVDGVDRFRAASNPALQVAVGADEGIPDRLERILDSIGIVDFDIDPTIVHTCHETTLEGNVWDELTRTAESDGGLLWLKADGQVAYRPRTWLLDRPVALTLSDQGEPGTLEYADPQTTSDTRALYNTVKIQRAAGGREQAAVADTTDALSDEGIRASARTDSVLANDRQVMDVALWVVGAYRTAGYRIAEVDVPLREDMGIDQWVAVLEADIGDRVEVRQTTPQGRPITSTGIIAGVSWLIRPGRKEWRPTFTLVAAPPAWPDFIADNDTTDLEGAGVLDTDTVGWG